MLRLIIARLTAAYRMDNFNMMGGGGNPSGGKKAVHVKVRLFYCVIFVWKGGAPCRYIRIFIMTTVGKLQYDQPPPWRWPDGLNM